MMEEESIVVITKGIGWKRTRRVAIIQHCRKMKIGKNMQSEKVRK